MESEKHDVPLGPTGHKLPPEIYLSRLPHYLVFILILALLVFANLLGLVKRFAHEGKGFQHEVGIFTFSRGKQGDWGSFVRRFRFCVFSHSNINLR